MILVLIGRSGSGKTAVAEKLVEKHGYQKVRTATTRERRDTEPENAYFFISKKEFMKRAKNDEFVEWDCYNGNCYGTLKTELQREGKHVIILTPEGAENIKREFPHAFIIQIEVPLKTAVIRAIQREETLTTEKLHQISQRGCSDDYLYKDTCCDQIILNPEGKSLDKVTAFVAERHEDWEKNMKWRGML